jgi:hypothetical protein
MRSSTGQVSSLRTKWYRVRLIHVMVLIALIAIGHRVPHWWTEAGLGVPDWWSARRAERAAHLREKAARDAWSGPVAIRVTSQDELGTMLDQFQSATARPGLSRGLIVCVDIAALPEAGQTLASPVRTDLDASGMPARDFLGIVLEPLGLACKLQDGMVMVTSRKSVDERIDYGHHGELFCDHGQRVRLMGKRPGLK